MTPASFTVERLINFAAEILVARGVSDSDARICAERLVSGDERGQRAHGLARLSSYVRRIEAGGLNPRATPRVIHELPSTAWVDGQNGLGPVVMTFAVELAATKARANGLAWIGVKGSNHAGANGVYAEMLTDRGLIGIIVAVANTNQVAPWGGKERLLGPNPIAIGLPAGEEAPMILDMATTTVSYGRVRQHAATGQPFPAGWLIDESGEPVTDPSLLDRATLKPIGDYKGYGLSLAIAALAGSLNGAASGSNVVDHYADWTTPTNTGQTVIALDPEAVQPGPGFRTEFDLRLREIRGSRPTKEGQTVLVPGDNSRVRRVAAEAGGIELAPTVLGELRALGRECGLGDALES
jgi:L-2-hydroxycarboxylate dehydrogenase (NAD+)